MEWVIHLTDVEGLTEALNVGGKVLSLSTSCCSQLCGRLRIETFVCLFFNLWKFNSCSPFYKMTDERQKIRWRTQLSRKPLENLFFTRLGKDPKSTHWRNLPPLLHLVGLTGTKANPGCTSAHWSLWGCFFLITCICPNFIIMSLFKWKFSLAQVTERLNNTHRSHFFWSDVFVLILKYSFHQFQMYLSDRYDHQQVHIGHWPACHVSSYLRVYCYPVISHCPTQPILYNILYMY